MSSQNIYFTADTHFYHRLMAERRGFGSVEEMNFRLIENWNRVVPPKGLVYHCGDFSLGKPGETLRILDQLNGTIFLVKGNHDNRLTHEIRARFGWVKDLYCLKVSDAMFNDAEKREIILCHYAMRVWDKAHYGTWHLYGHTHGDLSDLLNSRSMDVGVDCHDLAPITYGAVKDTITQKEHLAKLLNLKFYGHHISNE